jgi:hypothetical protein
MPIQQGYTQAAQKNSTLLKLQPPLLTNLKEKKKVFSFLLDLKRHHYARVTSVA